MKGNPDDPAYRIDLAALHARSGKTGQARVQIAALRRLNYAIRLDKQLAFLECLTRQGASPAHPLSNP